jgi:hypothetical protein
MYSIDGYVRYSIRKRVYRDGRGRCGKSLLNDLAMKTFGEYGYKLNSSVLMHELKAGVIQNSLIWTVRFVGSRTSGTMTASTLKEITGSRPERQKMF